MSHKVRDWVKLNKAMIPYFTVLYLFHLCIAFTGFTFGVADMGIQSLILKYWGNQGMDKRFFSVRFIENIKSLTRKRQIKKFDTAFPWHVCYWSFSLTPTLPRKPFYFAP